MKNENTFTLMGELNNIDFCTNAFCAMERFSVSKKTGYCELLLRSTIDLV